MPLTPHADVVVVVQGRAGATREELLTALRAWEKREGHVEQLGDGTREKGAPPAVQGQTAVGGRSARGQTGTTGSQTG